jgi:hypothetical protein
VVTKNMSEGGGKQPLEIDVKEWDPETFTVEGLRPDLQDLFKQGRITPHIVLRTKGEQRHLRNAFIRRIQATYERSAGEAAHGIETAHGPLDFVETTFWFEEGH